MNCFILIILNFTFLISFKKCLFSDTKYSAEIAEQYKDSGILILKMKDPVKENNDGLSNEDVVKIIQRINPRLVMLTGFGVKMMEADILYQAREIQKETKVQVIATKDGMVISPTSYAAKEGQRTFGTFQMESKKIEIRAPVEVTPTEPEKESKEEEQKTIPESTDTTTESQSDNQQNSQEK